MPADELQDTYAETDIAIIGLSGRFPGADSADALWSNVAAGRESVTFFSEAALARAGVRPELLRDPSYVKAAPILSDASLFDAAFFGYAPREAMTMDPQHRIFLECAWEALEQAGYYGDGVEGPIGVFAGSAMNTYILQLALRNQFFDAYLPTLLGNDKDFLATRASYKLNLRGPSLTIQTACSSSLVAIHAACQSLLAEECDMALAGGVSVRVPQLTGYLHEEGSVFSPDGHCRPFDARAQGTIFGSGGGVVALKRLTDALADQDHVWAVIKGSAINNDGSDKSDYTAPSVRQQARAIAEAHSVADVDPDTIAYVEAHGTGTYLGDPIEIAALTKAFREGTDKTQFCAIGSLKSNIGHLDAAAGVAGLIKTAYALKHKKIPPTINYDTPNPEINFDQTPFYVATELRDWSAEAGPRRAGVQSLGMGGTNAHVVMQEAPDAPPRSAPETKPRLYFVSAKTEAACEAALRNVADAAIADETLRLDDVAHTLRAGRARFAFRAAAVADSREALEAASVAPMRARQQAGEIGFLFSGQGSQYPTMARGLYETDPAFRSDLDHCLDGFTRHLHVDFRSLLFPGAGDEAAAAGLLQQTIHTQPALFSVEYALARRWMAWGVRPDRLLGHSIGEYAAAAIAGVFDLDAAIEIVAARAKLMQSCAPGAMLAVFAAPGDVAPRLIGDLCVSVINTPSTCVVSGERDQIDALKAQLDADGFQTSPLHTSHAFHSPMMAPIRADFAATVAAHRLSPPQIPIASNVTGAWLTAEQATSPEYWADHILQPVRFADGLGAMLAEGVDTLIEVGPGKTLCAFARQQPEIGSAVVVPSLRHPKETADDRTVLLHSAGALWSAGVAIDEDAVCAEPGARRAPLPTYPFQRESYWVEEAPEAAPALERARPSALAALSAAAPLETRRPPSEWLYEPVWTPQPLAPAPGRAPIAPGRWLVLADASGVGAELIRRLRANGADAVQVDIGAGFEELAEDHYRLNPAQPTDPAALVERLAAADRLPRNIVHLWSVDGPSGEDEPDAQLQSVQDRGIHSAAALIRSLAETGADATWRLLMVSEGMNSVDDAIVAPDPAKATLLGVSKMLAVEHTGARGASLDLQTIAAAPANPRHVAGAVLAEMAADLPDDVVSLVDGKRWTQSLEPVEGASAQNGAARIQDGGVYVIFGGLGGVGLEYAKYLAEHHRARLVLVGRSGLPPRDQWAASTSDRDDAVAAKILAVQALESAGAEVLVLSADVADRGDAQRVAQQTRDHFGAANGLIHSAGVIDAGGPLETRTREATEQALRAKLAGVLALDAAFADAPLDFFILNSSIASELYANFWGQAGYVAANSFVDAFARFRGALRPEQLTLAIDWDDWDLGMARAAETSFAERTGQTDFRFDPRNKMRPGEGVEALLCAIGARRSRVVASVRDLRDRLREMGQTGGLFGGESDTPTPAADPSSGAPFGPSGPSDLKPTIEAIWRSALGHKTVDHDSSFFEIGGHSLLGVSVLRSVGEKTGVRLNLAALYEAPTIRKLAERVAAEGGLAGSAAAPAAAHEPIAPAAPAEAAQLEPLQLSQADIVGFTSPSEQIAAAAQAAAENNDQTGPEAEADRPRLNRTEGFMRGLWNRLLQVVALYAPGMTSLRVWLHRRRGVAIGNNVAIGTAVHIETAYPWLVKIGDNVQISQHTNIVGHFRDMTADATRERRPTVVIEDDAFIGPGALLMPNITIGRGAVVAAGSVVSQSVEPNIVVQGNPARAVARATSSLALTDFATFAKGLEALGEDAPAPERAESAARP